MKCPMYCVTGHGRANVAASFISVCCHNNSKENMWMLLVVTKTCSSYRMILIFVLTCLVYTRSTSTSITTCLLKGKTSKVHTVTLYERDWTADHLSSSMRLWITCGYGWTFSICREMFQPRWYRTAHKLVDSCKPGQPSISDWERGLMVFCWRFTSLDLESNGNHQWEPARVAPHID